MPTSERDTVNYVGECGTENYLCGQCEGDCDFDTDCQGDLICFQRNFTDVVPGCVGEGGQRDVSSKDICTDPKLADASLKIDSSTTDPLREFAMFANIGFHGDEITKHKPIFVCDNGEGLLCDASEFSQPFALWAAKGLKKVKSNSQHTAYELHLYNIGTGRYFAPDYGDNMVRMVNSDSKSGLWTFEYGENDVVIIHPAHNYDEVLCIKHDGKGFYYKTDLGDNFPTEDMTGLEENCKFPMFGVDKFSLITTEEEFS